MLGSSQSIADANTVINTIVAEALSEFAERLEKAEDFRREAFRIIRHTMRDHKRILYNGNNYSEEWIKESGKPRPCPSAHHCGCHALLHKRKEHLPFHQMGHIYRA